MASHRIGARLSGLSPEQFFAFIEAQAPLWSAAALRVAEEHAARVEQPEWVLSEVLLSPDLAPHILAQLPTNDHAAKGTCRAWRRGWKETLARQLTPARNYSYSYGGALGRRAAARADTGGEGGGHHRWSDGVCRSPPSVVCA